MNNLKIILISLLLTLIISVLFTISSNKTNLLIFFIILVVMILNNAMNNAMNNASTGCPSKNITNNNLNSDMELIKIPIDKKNSNWTYDKIIPLDKYNRCDCTNDGSCIIPPDKVNIFPGFKKKKEKDYKYVFVKKNKEIPIEQIINNTNKCKLCKIPLTLLNNPITEKFTTYNPYREANRYESPDSLELDKKKKKIINTLVENIKNNKSNNNINLQDLKDLKDNICIHCKTGICLNDACYSI